MSDRYLALPCHPLLNTLLLFLFAACDAPLDPEATLLRERLEEAAFCLGFAKTGGESVCGSQRRSATEELPYSLLGPQELSIGIHSTEASRTGEYGPGLVRVSATVRLSNKLVERKLVAPTRPSIAREPGRVLLIPVSVTVDSTPGNVTSDQSVVTVEMPNHGTVKLADGWSGPLEIFSSQHGCDSERPDCYHYRSVPSVSPGEEISVPLTFDVDPTVHRFRVALVVLADTSAAEAR